MNDLEFYWSIEAPSRIEAAQRDLFVMECNLRRMKHMIECQWYAPYSDEEWSRFTVHRKELMRRNELDKK
jgi:hypothetical protein